MASQSESNTGDNKHNMCKLLDGVDEDSPPLQRPDVGSGEPLPLHVGIVGTEEGSVRTSAKSGRCETQSKEKPAKLHVTDGAATRPAEEQLWQKLENTMTAKQVHVLQVLEDFGIADVEPESDALEEQIWKVVQGELTFQEAVDLV